MQHLQEVSLPLGASNRLWLEGFGSSRDASIHATSSSECRDVDTVGDTRYREHLSTRELISEVRKLLTAERHVERLICRYLADLADRIRTREDVELEGYVDEFHAARCFFQLGVRTTRERVRMGRALRQLPQIERAFMGGELSYSRVREVTRVATPETEPEWLSLAQRLDMRALERRVAAAREGCGETDAAQAEGQSELGTYPSDEPIRAEWTTSKTVRVTFELGAETWALLERALVGARHLSAGTLTDSEAIEAVARDALSRQTEPADASDPRCSVVVYTCKQCSASELDTGSSALELDPAGAAAVGCGAPRIDLDHEGRGATRGGPLPAAVRRAVMLRDRCTCRVPGCNRRRYVEVHHLTPQASGGEHSRNNCVVLCTTHHRLLHDGKLQITGDADRSLDVRDSRGAPLVEPKPSSAFKCGSLSCIAHSDVAQQMRALPVAADDATQGESSASTRLLQIMGRRGNWTSDALVEASGLTANAVSSTLLLLELGGSVRNRDSRFELCERDALG